MFRFASTVPAPLAALSLRFGGTGAAGGAVAPGAPEEGGKHARAVPMAPSAQQTGQGGGGEKPSEGWVTQ